MTDPAKTLPDDDLARMLLTWQQHEPGAFRQLALALAAAGDVVGLQRIAESGVLALAKDECGRPDMTVFGAALMLADAHPGPAANAIVAQWAAATGGLTAQDCQDHLGKASEPAVVRQLLARGADPNGACRYSNSPRQTALDRAIGLDRGDAALAMLDWLAARDELPLVNIGLAESDGTVLPPESLMWALVTERPYGAARGLLARLDARNVPALWRRECGNALRAKAKRNVLGDRNHSVITPVRLELLALADFVDPEEWVSVCSSGYGSLAEYLVTPVDHIRQEAAARQQTIENMLAAGVHPDDVRSRILCDDTLETTLLQSAVYHGNVAFTRLLLDGGADPTRRTRLATGHSAVGTYHDRDAFELADLRAAASTQGATPAAEEVKMVLAIWRAQQALLSTVRGPADPIASRSGKAVQ